MKTKVAEKRFDFRLSWEDVNVGVLGKLVVRTHLDPLVLLFVEGIFNDNALLHDQVQDQIKRMRDQQNKTAALNTVRKEREEKKAADAGKQSLLSPVTKRKLSSPPTPASGKKGLWKTPSPTSTSSSASTRTPSTTSVKCRKITTLFTEKLDRSPIPPKRPTEVLISSGDEDVDE